MAAQEVVTVAELKAFIPITDSTDDTVLGVFLASTIAQVKKYLGTNIIETDHAAEAYTVEDRTRYVILKHAPIHGTVTVTENDEALVEDTDFGVDLDTGILTRIGCYWSDEQKAVKVTYKSGYAANTIPEDIRLAVLEQAKFYYRRRDEIGLTGKSLEGSITLNEGYQLLKGVRELLDPYRVGQRTC